MDFFGAMVTYLRGSDKQPFTGEESMKVTAISVSDRKGIRKENIDSATLRENYGLQDDAHGGKWHRQVSLLAEESIQFMREKGLDVVAGNFAENITTEGLDLTSLSVGTHLNIGDTELIISQLGKVCHNRCAIYHQAGDCVMPREGIFAIVIKGGVIQTGDAITLPNRHSESLAVILTAQQEKEFGPQIAQLVQDKWESPVVRFDTLNAAKDNLATVIKDLTQLQRVTRAVLFDPEQYHALNLNILGKPGKDSNIYHVEDTTLHYCTSLEQLQR